jgi:hypothetical protein
MQTESVAQSVGKGNKGLVGLSGYCTGNGDTESMFLAVAALLLSENV